jgi:hypothetical protein
MGQSKGVLRVRHHLDLDATQQLHK